MQSFFNLLFTNLSPVDGAILIPINNKITAKGGGYVAAEDAALPETTDTYDRASTAIKFLYAVGRTTGQAQAAR